MKKTVSILIISFVSLFFIAACLFVYLTRGKNRHAIKLKLKTGAIIIGLTSLATQSCVTVTCYDVAATDYIRPLDSISNENHVIINHTSDSTIDFAIDFSQSSKLFYLLGNYSENNLSSGEVKITKGSLSESYCEFAVPIENSTNQGSYFLKIFKSLPADTTQNNYFYSIDIDITN